MIKKIGIFFDISNKIGLGHLQRCLNFIVNFKKENYKIYFYYISNKDNKLIFDIIKKKIKNCSINYNSCIKTISKIISSLKFDLFLIDSYSDNYNLEVALKEEVNKLLIFDNYPYKKHNCNYLIDYTINKLENFHKKNLNEDCKILYGIDKVVLNSNFYNFKNFNVKKNIKNILIMMGGTDVNNDTLIILKKLIKINNFNLLNFKVIITDFYSEKKLIIELCKKYKNVEVLLNINNDDIPSILNEIDLLINTAGTSNFEALYFGIPCITIFTRDFHYEHFRFFIDNKLLFILDDKNNLEEIIQHIKLNYENISNDLIKYIPKSYPLIDFL